MRTQLLPLLPPVVHASAGEADATLGHTVRLLGAELAERRVATSVAVDRIVDLLLVQLLRIGLDGRAGGIPSLLRAFDDPLVVSALDLLHADPARRWTVDALAGQLSVSRTTLIRRFASVVGELEGGYLLRWRMDLASVRLRDGNDTLEVIAGSFGYQSAQGFSRAFTQSRGVPPARYRRLARSLLDGAGG